MKKLVLLFAAVTATMTAIAQIPNAGFETWTNTAGYNTPTGWDNLNATTNALSVYTCTKGTPGFAGSSYLQLTSKTVTGFGVAPGVAVSGLIDVTNYAPKSGFPNTTRPVSLTGSWQYMAYGSDAGSVTILLSKWNSTMMMRDTIAYASQTLSGMVMSWASFTIPLTYRSSSFPDSAMIILSASGTTPVNNSYLYVDDLAFAGSVPSGVTSVNNILNDVSVFPNPATTEISVGYSATETGSMTINISDITGKVISSTTHNSIQGKNTVSFNTASFSKGIYLVTLVSDAGKHTEKIVIE